MKKILNYFKEYLSVILIVPTIIGGLYQLINIIYYVVLLISTSSMAYERILDSVLWYTRV